MPTSKEINLLLVDDRPENLLSLEALLEAKDLALIRAYSGEEALKRHSRRLATQVEDRTAELEQANQSLRMEIAERARVEQVNARLAAIVESSDDAITSAVMDGTILSWNQGAEQIYGYKVEEIL